VNKKSSSWKRLIGAAASGAVFAVIVGIFPWMNIIVRFVLMNVVAAIIMLFIAFKRMKMADLFKQVITLYLITYSIGGLINSIYYHTDFKLYLMNLGNALTFSNISWRFIISVILLLIPVVLLIFWLYRRCQSEVRETYEVELFLENRSIHTKGFMDTGNCLYDPVFKKPVMVIESSLLEHLLSTEFCKDLDQAKQYLDENADGIMQLDIKDEHLRRLRFIPYQSIGKTQGMMLGLLLDKILINTGTQKICNEKVTAAICDNHLSTKEDYHVILHKDLV
jgi:stage II sporulation protein GA (sporulation sigma-E factor processing peptidase)